MLLRCCYCSCFIAFPFVWSFANHFRASRFASSSSSFVSRCSLTCAASRITFQYFSALFTGCPSTNFPIIYQQRQLQVRIDSLFGWCCCSMNFSALSRQKPDSDVVRFIGDSSRPEGHSFLRTLRSSSRAAIDPTCHEPHFRYWSTAPIRLLIFRFFPGPPSGTSAFGQRYSNFPLIRNRLGRNPHSVGRIPPSGTSTVRFTRQGVPKIKHSP